MKVSNVMQKKVDYVYPDTPIRRVTEIIFGNRFTGVSVVENHSKKLVGFITDQDMLDRCFPSIEEYMEDIVHESDFQEMEKKLKNVLEMKATDIMSKKVTYIKQDDHIMKAVSKMKLKDLSRIPVVDDNKKLIGVLSKKDIFKVLVGKYS